MAQFCAQCGAPLEAEARFCAECGHLVGAAPTGGESGPPEIPTPEPAPTAAAVAGAGGGGGVGRRVLIGFLVLALVAGGVVAGVALSGGDEAGANEITLESAGSEGRDPFTSSTVTDPPPDSTSPTVPPPPPPLDTTAQGTELSGGSAGLYGGSLNQGACDVEKQIAFLEQDPAKARAFAGVLGISVGEIPAHLRGLTPMILRYDTRVTNHGFFNDRATPRQSVLQAGTAVLVDRFGVPRVKCGCGNPLTPPLDLNDKVTYFGEQWDGFSLRDTVIIIENDIDIDIFVLVDFDRSEYYRRFRGDDGTNDTLGDGTGGSSTSSSTTASTAPQLVPGAACTLGSSPDCIDPDGDGQGVYLLGGAQCMATFPDSPGLCSDLDGDGHAGYPDSG
jgi:hypothetical protein